MLFLKLTDRGYIRRILSIQTAMPMKSIDIGVFSTEAIASVKDVLDILVSLDETVVLKENGEPVYTIAKGAIHKNSTATDFPAETEQDKLKRIPGTAKGQIWISPDFDELPDDIAQAFGMID